MKLMGIREAAKTVGVGEMALRRACGAGKIPVVMLGAKTYVVLEQVKRWMDRAEGLLNAAAVAEKFGLSESAVRIAHKRGELPGVWVDHRLLFREEEVRAALMDKASGGEPGWQDQEADEDFADIEDGGEEEPEAEEDFS